MKYVISALIIIGLGFLIYKQIVGIVEKVKQKKQDKLQVDLQEENKDNKEIKE